MISARLRVGADVLLVAPVRGLWAEARTLTEELDRFAPEAVGVGASGDELASLVTYFLDSDGDPLVPLTPNESRELRGLARYGEARVPNPAAVETLRWGRAHATPVVALDPDDQTSADLFHEHIGYVELVRRTVRERRVGRHPPSSANPDAFAVDWDRAVGRGRGSRRLARARNDHLASEVRRLTAGRSRVGVVVDRERFDGVRELLGAPAGPHPGWA